MLEFIVGKMGFWAVVVLLSLISLGISVPILFSKLEGIVPKRILRWYIYSNVGVGILGVIFFLIALVVRSWVG